MKDQNRYSKELEAAARKTLRPHAKKIRHYVSEIDRLNGLAVKYSPGKATEKLDALREKAIAGDIASQQELEAFYTGRDMPKKYEALSGLYAGAADELKRISSPWLCELGRELLEIVPPIVKRAQEAWDAVCDQEGQRRSPDAWGATVAADFRAMADQIAEDTVYADVRGLLQYLD